MAISIGSVIETEDNLGSTVAYTGTATTTVSNVPVTADKAISQILVGAGGKNLEVSFDGGTTYFPMSKSEVLTWDVKGSIQQVKIKATTGTVDYRLIINFEDV